MSTGFKNSLNIVLTGWSGSGKSEQIKRVFNACEPVPPPEGSPPETKARKRFPFRPMLVIYCDPSTAATMADVLAHKDCTAVQVAPDGEKFAEALTAALEAGHVRADGVAVPFATVVFDGWTAMTEGERGDAREAARAGETAAKTVDQKDTSNDERKLSAAANRAARTAIKRWNSHVMTSDGVLFLSTAHAAEKWVNVTGPKAKQGERRQSGEQFDLPPKAREWLYRSCNMSILVRRLLPEVTAEQLDATSLDDETCTPTYDAILKPVVLDGSELDLVKYQRGVLAGMPVRWHDPDLGAALLLSPLRK